MMKTAVLNTRPGETHPEPATLNASWTAEASRAGWNAEQFRQANHLGPAGTGRSGHREQVLPKRGMVQGPAIPRRRPRSTAPTGSPEGHPQVLIVARQQQQHTLARRLRRVFAEGRTRDASKGGKMRATLARQAMITATLAMLGSGCTDNGASATRSGDGLHPTSLNPCRTPVNRAALPQWARTGFRGDGSGTPHVTSDGGHLIAVLFSFPLIGSPDPHEENKILWISSLPQGPMEPLEIEASLVGGGVNVHRTVAGGPGPSAVNLPTRGCWQLGLRWSGHADMMLLQVDKDILP